MDKTWQATPGIRARWLVAVPLAGVIAIAFCIARGNVDATRIIGPAMGGGMLVAFVALAARSELAKHDIRIVGGELSIERSGSARRLLLTAETVHFARWEHSGTGALGTIVVIDGEDGPIRFAVPEDILPAHRYDLPSGYDRDYAVAAAGLAHAVLAAANASTELTEEMPHVDDDALSPAALRIPLRAHATRDAFLLVMTIIASMLVVPMALLPFPDMSIGGNILIKLVAWPALVAIVRFHLRRRRHGKRYALWLDEGQIFLEDAEADAIVAAACPAEITVVRGITTSGRFRFPCVQLTMPAVPEPLCITGWGVRDGLAGPELPASYVVGMAEYAALSNALATSNCAAGPARLSGAISSRCLR